MIGPVRWKSGTEYFDKMREKSQKKTYMPRGYNLPFHRQHRQISLLIAVETNLFCILLRAMVL